MFRRPLYLALVMALFAVGLAWAQEDGPPISITSPDQGVTYARATIKTHSLAWNKRQKLLIAYVTFVPQDIDSTQYADDTHEFRFPGVSFDPAKGIFTVVSAKGEVIPIAHIKKTLFIKSIEVLPNANIRILHPKGEITVILEAISPDDPAMNPPAENSDPDATQKVDINQVLN